MKYAITGAAGHISKPLAEQLLEAGHDVTVIGRNKERLKDLVQSGAHTSVGSLEDGRFLTNAFEGIDAVYTMYPPNFMSDDIKSFYEQLGKNYAEAIKANKIKWVVNLSSVGAHLSEGTGPVSGLYRAEKLLNSLEEVNVRHLRPTFFFQNFLTYIDMIRNMGFMGSNFSLASNQFPVSDINDVAAVAAGELKGLSFSGHSVRYIASDETGTDKIASVLGNAIGNPGLKWIKLNNEQVLQGLQQAGMSKKMAGEHIEMFSAIDTGEFLDDYWQHRPKLESIKLEDFAIEFTAVYKQANNLSSITR